MPRSRENSDSAFPPPPSPDEPAVDPHDVELLAGVLAGVDPITMIRAISVALLGVAVQLQEAGDARSAAEGSTLLISREQIRINALAEGYLLRRIAEIDSVLDGLDVETLSADHVRKLNAERDRLLAVFGARGAP